MLHEAIFLATCNATMTNKKPFKLQRGCYTQATCLATLRKVEGRSTFLATRNATIAVAKWGVTREFFLATCIATNIALQAARKIASCNMALRMYVYNPSQYTNNTNSRIKHNDKAPFVFFLKFKNLSLRENCKMLNSQRLQKYEIIGLGQRNV